MEIRRSHHTRSVIQALVVTFLWSTSWVFIKLGLQDIPALSFAGLRYGFAFLFLLPVIARPYQINQLKQVSPKVWLHLILLGLVYYTVTQGTQFISLVYLPAATVSLMLSFTSILVAFMGIAFLSERPSLGQWLGLLVYLGGILYYFLPLNLPPAQAIGLVVAGIGVLANALSSIMGRNINRTGDTDPLLVTTISMGAGSLVLFLVGIASQGLPDLSFQNWLIILWLAAVNTAFAFTLWNHTLRHLSAMESSVINNTMLFQISLLAWAFLGEKLTLSEILGIVLASIGTLIVQVRRSMPPGD